MLARMRQRLLFPIRNERGDVVGFGGRLVPLEQTPAGATSAAKYINTPQTDLYHKSEVLYRLHEARSAIVKSRRALVVEGYMDALSLAEAGLQETVACCGTALTPEQLGRVMKVAEEVVFVFDGDEAGRRAAWRAARLCLQHYRADRRMRFLLLPQDLDPDDLVRGQGAQAMLQQLGRTMDLSDFVLRWLKKEHRGLKSVEDRAAFLASVKQLLSPLGPQVDFARLMLKEAHRLAAGSHSASRVAPAGRPMDQAGFPAAGLRMPNAAWRSRPKEPWIEAKGSMAPPNRWAAPSTFVAVVQDGVASDRARSGATVSYWQRLEQAIEAAPLFACSMRQELLDALDETRAVEA
ncbi:MAG: toprim domain-containing protein, partial [Rhodocyclaceae bacterium]|nr:toprim domain-containing protein [Rhodocyclaceae bacterium]